MIRRTGEYLKVPEAAAEVGVTAQTMRQFCRDGSIVSIDASPDRWIHRSHLDLFKQSYTRPNSGRPRKAETVVE